MGWLSKHNIMIWDVKSVLSMASTSPTVGIPALGKGGGESHSTSTGALGLHLLSSQMPIKIDRQGLRMARPGMLGPWLPSVSNFMSFPKTTVCFLNVLKHYLKKKVKCL